MIVTRRNDITIKTFDYHKVNMQTAVCLAVLSITKAQSSKLVKSV